MSLSYIRKIMIEYFMVYALLWILAYLQAIKSNTESNKLFWMQGVVLLVFSALRFETGYDWPVYSSHYNGEMGDAGLVFEPGYQLLVFAFTSLGIPFKYYLSCITAAMIVALMALTKRITPKYKEIAIAITFSLPDFYLIPIFSVIRQTMSLLILLIGIMWLCEGKKKRAYFLIIASFAFHYSTLIIFPLILFVRSLKLGRSTYYVIFIFSFFGYLTSIDFASLFLKSAVELFMPSYGMYMSRDTFNASFFYRAVTGLLTIMIALAVAKSRTYANKDWGGESSFSLNIGLLALLLPILLFNYPTFTSRFMFLGSFFIMALSLYYFHEVLNVKKFVTCLICSVVFALPLYRFLSSSFSTPFVPYQSMLFYDESNSTGNERTQDLLDMLDSLW